MKRFLALFMSWLIILLPVSTAAIYGLNNGEVKGNDNIPGYVRNSQDLFSFWVYAQLPTDPTITPDQVRLPSGRQFEACVFDDSHPDLGYLCSLPNQDFHTLRVCDSENFQVALYDDRGTQTRYQADIRSVCDHLPPEIVSISTDKQLYAAGDTVRITANIREKASTESSVRQNECVGLKSVILNGEEHLLEEPQGRCTLQESFTLAASDLADGPNTIPLIAKDYFDQSATASVSFRVDKTLPAFTLHELQITEGNAPVVYYAPIPVAVSFSIDITESDLNSSSVAANLALFGLANQPVTCQAPVNGVTRCSWAFPYTLTAVNFNFDIPITVSDNAGNRVTQNIALTHDFQQDTLGPRISELRILKNGQPLTGWFSRSISSVDVSVGITDPETGLNINSLGANLQALNPVLINPSYSPGPSPCTLAEGVWECTWRDVLIDLPSGQNQVSISFTAADNAGQSTTTPLSATLKIDEEGPQAASLVSNHVDDGADPGVSWLGSQNNTLTATFTENNAMNSQMVFLDLSPIGGSIRVPATSCDNSTTSKTCTWEGVAATQGTGAVTLRFAESADALGNPLQPNEGFSFSIDREPPTVSSSSFRTVQTSQNSLTTVPTLNSGLEIIADVSDSSLITAVTDYSGLQQGATSKQADCVATAAGYRCTWNQEMLIDRPGPFDANLILIFTDVAGNEHRETLPVRVYGTGGQAPVDYWDLAVGEPSPHGIDRSLVTFYDPFIWFPITLTPKQQNVFPVDIQVGDCSGQNTLLSSEKNKPEIVDFNSVANRQPGHYQFYLKYTMKQRAPESPVVPVTCNINIRTLVNDETVSIAESQEVAVEIPYYNNPLGNAAANIDAEIEKAKDSWLVKAEWLDIANTILRFAQTVCRFLYRWEQIKQTWAAITDGFKSCCATTFFIFGGPNSPCCQAQTAEAAGLEAGKETFKKLYRESGNKWCKLLSCQMWKKDWLGSDSDTPYGSNQRQVTDREPTPESDPWSTSRIPEEGAGASWYQRIIASPWFLQNQANSREDYFGNVDPQGSLILSIAFLCLPGIIFNLQKARAIECEYIGCLKLAKDGLPVSICSERKSYQQCKFVFGEFFNLIPFAAAISVIAQNILTALSSPLALVGFIASGSCRITCATPTPNPIPGLCTACSYADFLNVFLEIGCDLGLGGCTPFWQDATLGNEVCDKALRDEE